MIPLLLVLLSADSCNSAALLPAYAHNDYRNRRPLHDALALGYRGVEADVFRVGTELLVGHDRGGALRGAGTLAQLYLAPLRDRLHTCGYVLSDSTPLFLNVELKEADPVAFQYLLDQLREFEELFAARQTGRPAVQLTLVGWWPPPTPSPDSVAWPDYLRVQLAIEQLEHIPVIDSARVGFVSVDYEKFLRGRGNGAQLTLRTANELAKTLGKPLRVHHAPADLSVYSWLLWEGVRLIGTTDLRRSREILAPFVINARRSSVCCE